MSTDEVYGTLGATGLFTETTPYAPNSPYSASKASSDHFVRAYGETYGLPFVITNCSNNEAGTCVVTAVMIIPSNGAASANPRKPSACLK